MIGISYDSFLSLTALVNPHPALKSSAPKNPMVDGWRGDDWFHNGAFREQNISYIYEQEGTRDNTEKWWQSEAEVYDLYLRGVAAGAVGEAHGLGQMGFWRKLTAHPSDDSFWQDQAMDRILARRPITVPVLRHRESLADPKPIQPGVRLDYHFGLPTADHVFLPGHRIMVQVQSSWFPLYDRNPQAFVPNIFFAKASDCRPATQSVTVAGPHESYISLPLAP